MSTDELRPFAYVVLALVGERGAGAHDIASMMARSPIYWDAAQSQWYAEPKRLADAGYLRAHTRPGKTTDRTHYTMTAKGRAALRRWLAQPARFTRMQNEAAIRLLAGDLIDDATIVESLDGLRPELDRLEASLVASERIAEDIPERTRYLLLSHRLARRLIDAHRQWIAEVEAELGPDR
jgi:PadR family transcriptional regulator, regulatory protein AphA